MLICIDTFVTYFSFSFSYYSADLRWRSLEMVCCCWLSFFCMRFRTYYFSHRCCYFCCVFFFFNSYCFSTMIFTLLYFYFGFNINVAFPFALGCHMDDWLASKCKNSSYFIILIIHFFLSSPPSVLFSLFSESQLFEIKISGFFSCIYNVALLFLLFVQNEKKNFEFCAIVII